MLMVAALVIIDFASTGIMMGFEMLLQQRHVVDALSEIAAASPHASIFMPIVLDLIFQLIVMTGTFLKMFYIGRFLYQNHDRMGWE
jgi:hypothetical protein